MATAKTILAPELAISEWFNTSTPLTLTGLHGRPVLLHSFQLLCPGCVSQSIPQVQKIERVFADTDLQIIGIHTVFEHHAAMSPVTLKAFLHEYRIRHAVGVDQPDLHSDTPITMQRFGLRGTPSSVLIGRDGTIKHHIFGVEDDIAVGARIAMALAEKVPELAPISQTDHDTAGCADGRCEIPAQIAS